jgi:hypothetical protein
MRLGSLVLRSSTASRSKFGPPSTSGANSKNGTKEEEAKPRTTVPAEKQKQEGESYTTNKIEQQIKDHETEAKSTK